MSFILAPLQDYINSIPKAMASGQPADRAAFHKQTNKYRLYAAIAAIVSAVLLTVGLLLCASGVGIGAGISLSLLALSTGCVSYNIYKVLGNIKDIMDHPQPFIDGNGIKIPLLRQSVEAGTCAGFIIAPCIESLAKRHAGG